MSPERNLSGSVAQNCEADKIQLLDHACLKLGDVTAAHKQKDHPPQAGCSTGHKALPLHISRWDTGQTVNSKYKLNKVGLMLLKGVTHQD